MNCVKLIAPNFTHCIKFLIFSFASSSSKIYFFILYHSKFAALLPEKHTLNSNCVISYTHFTKKLNFYHRHYRTKSEQCNYCHAQTSTKETKKNRKIPSSKKNDSRRGIDFIYCVTFSWPVCFILSRRKMTFNCVTYSWPFLHQNHQRRGCCYCVTFSCPPSSASLSAAVPGYLLVLCQL